MRISPSMLSGQLILSFFRSCLVNHNVEMSLAQYPCYIQKTYSCSRHLALSVFLFLRLWCSLSLRCRVVLWMCQHPSVSWASLVQLGIPRSAGHPSVGLASLGQLGIPWSAEHLLVSWAFLGQLLSAFFFLRICVFLQQSAGKRNFFNEECTPHLHAVIRARIYNVFRNYSGLGKQQ